LEEDDEDQVVELLTITVDIGNGQQENITVFEGDSAYDLARAFALKHALDFRLTDLLASQIQSNIDQVVLSGGAGPANEGNQPEEGQEPEEGYYQQMMEMEAAGGNGGVEEGGGPEYEGNEGQHYHQHQQYANVPRPLMVGEEGEDYQEDGGAAVPNDEAAYYTNTIQQ
jgi:hypothetical protein